MKKVHLLGGWNLGLYSSDETAVPKPWVQDAWDGTPGLPWASCIISLCLKLSHL